MNYKDGNSQHNNVYDLTATRIVKKKTGATVPIKLDRTPTSEDLEKHHSTVVRE